MAHNKRSHLMQSMWAERWADIPENAWTGAEHGAGDRGADSGLNQPLKVRSHLTFRWFGDILINLTHPRSAVYYFKSSLARSLLII